MAEVATTVPKDATKFNPNNEFTILFNLRFSDRNPLHPFGLLHMVWRAPVLPQEGDILHIGEGGYGFVIKIDKRPRQLDYLSWSDDHTVTINAELLHIPTRREYLARLSKLIEEVPRYESLLRGSLHIMESVALQMEATEE